MRSSPRDGLFFFTFDLFLCVRKERGAQRETTFDAGQSFEKEEKRHSVKMLYLLDASDDELLQAAVMMKAAAADGTPLAALLTDLPPHHFYARQLGVSVMQGSSATLGRPKGRWVSVAPLNC